MEYVRRLLPTLVIALLTVAMVAAVLFTSGGTMFSPGPLNAESRLDVKRGGVSSHAELGGNCSACHASPWSGQTMASLCLDCHTDVRSQILNRQPLHGRLPEGTQCRDCHVEHSGPHGALTDLARFDHDCAAFKLTGAHRAVDCRSCHVNQTYRGTPQTCVACHAEPKVHLGRFGTDCQACHSTSTWRGAVFQHKFPLNHGGGKHTTRACATCHTAQDDFRSYTCYGCHRHDPEKTEEKHWKKGIVEIQNCAGCHPTGRKDRRDREKHHRKADRVEVSDVESLLSILQDCDVVAESTACPAWP